MRLAPRPLAGYHLSIMATVAVVLLVADVFLSLVSRAVMKRFVARRLGAAASDALLEIDFWKASSEKPVMRCLLFVELLSWVAVALLVARLAVPVIQHPKV